MTAFSRPSILIAIVLTGLISASAAQAVPMAKPANSSSNIVKVYDRYDRYHHHYYRGRHVVHAPFTRVEHGRRTVVDAPFVHVYQGRHGTHVVAPFVNYWD